MAVQDVGISGHVILHDAPAAIYVPWSIEAVVPRVDDGDHRSVTAGIGGCDRDRDGDGNVDLELVLVRVPSCLWTRQISLWPPARARGDLHFEADLGICSRGAVETSSK